MGQGSYTGLATLLAEELDADWDKVRVEGAPADVKRYNNLAFGPMQGTGGSTAMANSWEQMRNAGATAKAMLVAAAAQRWSVPVSEISVDKGVVSHAGSGRSAGFGDLVEAAASLPVPEQVQLKDQGLQADRQARAAPQGQHRQDRWQRHLHPGLQAARHAGGHGCLSATLRRRAALGRQQQGQGRA